MGQTLAILGRQPALGLAELESLFGANQIKPLKGAALLDAKPEDVHIGRLGGTIKVCKLLTTLPFTDWQKIAKYIVEQVPEHTKSYTPGKLTLGISAYGLKVSPKSINTTALEAKKAIRKTGRPVRVVPNKESELSSAQVLHNNLTDLPLGMELVMFRAGDSTLLTQTIAVQDIEAYAARDQARPKRDAKVGMLPPKLAQIIVNLAVGKSPISSRQSPVVLDPFCGTGVILQEALLMDYKAYGTDLDPRMIEYSEANLKWLRINPGPWKLAEGDATNFRWQPFDTIACETYLGRPFSALPKPEVLNEVIRDVDTIHKLFLQNVAMQTQPGFRMCIAVPAWAAKYSFKHLKVLESLEELGYTRLSFAHVRDEDLIYHRPGQIVGRELVLLVRR